MRLDKFLGKADGDLKVIVYNRISGETIFYVLDYSDYSTLKEEMKNYKVTYYKIESGRLIVDVKER